MHAIYGVPAADTLNGTGREGARYYGSCSSRLSYGRASRSERRSFFSAQ